MVLVPWWSTTGATRSLQVAGSCSGATATFARFCILSRASTLAHYHLFFSPIFCGYYTYVLKTNDVNSAAFCIQAVGDSVGLRYLIAIFRHCNKTDTLTLI